jgi:transcription antitermination factor NusB
MGKRRRAREKALIALYRMDIREESDEVILKELSAEGLDPYTRALVKKTSTHLKKIDSLIQKVAENWKFQRIAIIDRIILRFAICELLYFPEVPKKVTIDEAIEIAKKYSTKESGRFVNGILDQIAKEL